MPALHPDAPCSRATSETQATHAEQARELWSKDEKKHLRPGHFWACQLDDADGKGSPILHEFKKKNEYFTLSNGEKVRGDPGECLLLLRCYYHRTAKDAQGLTFKRWVAKKGEILVLNSSELRAVQGHQKNDFILNPINPPQQRAQSRSKSKGAKAQEVVYPSSQEWALDAEVDMDTRRACEAS